MTKRWTTSNNRLSCKQFVETISLIKEDVLWVHPVLKRISLLSLSNTIQWTSEGILGKLEFSYFLWGEDGISRIVEFWYFFTSASLNLWNSLSKKWNHFCRLDFTVLYIVIWRKTQFLIFLASKWKWTINSS